MRYPIILLGASCFMLLPACARAPEPEVEFDQAAEEAAVRNVLEGFKAAYNKHDAQAMPSFFSDEGIVLWRDDVTGGAAIEDVYTDMFDRNKDVRAEIVEDFGIRFLTPTVAVWRGVVEYTGLLGADGEALPPSTSQGALMIVKQEGQWRCAAMFEGPTEIPAST